MVYDVTIVGAGPAGLSAAIYAKRACLNMLVLQDKYSIGSQICSTTEVDNYPGLYHINGADLYNRMKEHAISLGVNIVSEKVIEFSNVDNEIKLVKTSDNLYETKSIILATGATPKKGGLNHEDDFVGMGVSYCATCDGAFYKDKVVAVIGGGDVAVGDAIFLSHIAKHVYLLVRRNEMRAATVLQESVKKLANVEILYETLADSIISENGKFTGLMIKGKGSNIVSELTCDGVFVGIGIAPATSLLKDKVLMDGDYIVAPESCETSAKGVYAVGDIRKKTLRQVITACADGANAVASLEKYLNENNLRG